MKLLTALLALFLIAETATAVCPAKCCPEPAREEKQQTDPVTEILEKLDQATKDLKTYQARIDYLFIQDPELLDSRTLRKGNLLYKKQEKQSLLRINFDTISYDDGEQLNRKEQYIFDGVWLVKIDYHLKNIDRYEISEPQKPVEVFEYIGDYLPIIGFSDSNSLSDDFNIEIIEKDEEPANTTHLALFPKKTTEYGKEYKKIEIFIDKTTNLPVQIVSVEKEGNVHKIALNKAIIDKKIENTVFKVAKPDNFSENIHSKEK